MKYFAVLACLLLAGVALAQETSTAEPPTEAPTTAKPTEAPTEAPTTAKPTEAPTEAPTTAKPTEAPTTAMPTEAPTTAKPTEAPTTMGPTPVPPTMDNKFYAKDENGTVCLIMVANTFNVTGSCSSTPVSLMVNVNETDFHGNCDVSADTLMIMEKKGAYGLTMVFTMTGNNYHLTNLSVTVGDCKGESTGLQADLRAPSANVYRCNAEQTLATGNTSVLLAGVRLQAFRKDTNSTELSGQEYICMGDSTISNIVPIAVGCALAGLIVIVLIAYIIGRLRRRPYEPV
jgi:hypothetical protein